MPIHLVEILQSVTKSGALTANKFACWKKTCLKLLDDYDLWMTTV